MHPRFDAMRVGADAYKAMRGLQAYVNGTSLEASLKHLVKIRASQINQCAFCLHMHNHEARKEGESQERLDLIGAWREAPVFSARERAALAWAESVTLVAESHVPDEVYDAARGVLRTGTRRADDGCGGYQQLEPADGCLPHPARGHPERLTRDPLALRFEFTADPCVDCHIAVMLAKASIQRSEKNACAARG